MPLDHGDPGCGVHFHASDGAVEAEQIRLLLQNPADVPANLINAGLVALIVWPLYPAWTMVLWLGLVCIVSLTRGLLRHRFAHATGDARTSPNWARLFTLNAFVAGCLWGVSASVILMTPDPVYYNFIIFVLGGMMAGGIVCIAVNLRAILAFILPTILPAIAALAVHGGLVQIEMALMLALFTFALVWTGRSINRSITENVRLRFGQEALVIKLRSSEAAMAASQAIAHVGTWVIDLQSKSSAWSAETYRIFGVDPAVFKPSFEALLARTHPDDRKTVSADYETLLATGTSRGIDYRIVMNDGTVKHVHELGQAIYDANGRPVQVIGTVQDVTEQIRDEAASAMLAAIVNSSNDAIISETVAGTILSWNKGAEQLYGYRAEEAIGQSVRMIIPEERRHEVDRNLAALANHQGIDPFDTERLRKDGTRVPVSIAVSLTRDAEHTVVGASIIARDISDRRVAADALAYRDRLSHAVTVGTGMLVKAQSLDLGMPEALRVVGEAMRVDRILVVQSLVGRVPPLAWRHYWEATDIQVSIAGAQFPAEGVGPTVGATWDGLLTDGKPVIVQLAISEGPVRDLLDRIGTKSMVIVPIFVGDVFWGGLSADACATAREWSENEIDTLRTFADIAGALIQRAETLHSLETSEARFRAVTETAQDAIITIDGAARIGLWNRAAERILGYTEVDPIGWTGIGVT